MKKFILLFLSLVGISAGAQDWGVVNISVCNMRNTANFSAEMVSQALLGTPVQVLQISDNGNPWPEVVTPDDYSGWVHYAAITVMSQEELKAWNAAPKVVVTALTGEVHAKACARSATVSDVVAGDRLKHLGTQGAWLKVGFPDGREGFLRKTQGMPEKQWRKQLSQSPEAILKTAKSMMGFPYIWAGMSPKGMDCSGFVRTVLFMHDIIIPRDASEQAEVGERIEKLEDLQPGDLVFFGRFLQNRKPRVSHVGFYLGNGRFIHCMGLVKEGSLFPEDPLYDVFNTGRFLFGGRFLPFINQDKQITTTLTNPFYAE
ncbi:MAG: C40 family peptidase [Bacteroidales bacterium]|nr:C40 family peptidase [Bacteroidales bacterium]